MNSLLQIASGKASATSRVKNYVQLLLVTFFCTLMVDTFAAQKIELSMLSPAIKSNQFGFDSLLSKQKRRAALLYKTLVSHYQQNSADPDYILSDFKIMANYYSQFPRVVSLLSQLKSKHWSLVFRENIWSTVATGSALNVDSASIHFNTRSAAKLKFHNSCNANLACIASPADALLHELLHAHSMLVKTMEFIQQGGMNRFRYPFKHEYSVIKNENALYASMNLVDGIKRPQRNEHSGQKIIASCVTCIK